MLVESYQHTGFPPTYIFHQHQNISNGNNFFYDPLTVVRSVLVRKDCERGLANVLTYNLYDINLGHFRLYYVDSYREPEMVIWD